MVVFGFVLIYHGSHLFLGSFGTHFSWLSSCLFLLLWLCTWKPPFIWDYLSQICMWIGEPSNSWLKRMTWDVHLDAYLYIYICTMLRHLEKKIASVLREVAQMGCPQRIASHLDQLIFIHILRWKWKPLISECCLSFCIFGHFVHCSWVGFYAWWP